MSTTAPDPTAGDAFAYFLTEQIPTVIDLLITAQEIAQARGFTAIVTAASEIAIGLLDDVNAVAVKMSGIADETILLKLEQSHTARRPRTGDMETHIRSLPGPLGSVRVALIEELDKIINPRGWGTFWRAQEYGTGTDRIPSQIGRPLMGVFEDSGTPPEGAQRGLGVGLDIAYIPGGLPPGPGAITVDLPPRHFLRDGSAEAGARYIAEMDAVQTRWITRIKELQDKLLQLASQGRTITGYLQA